MMEIAPVLQTREQIHSTKAPRLPSKQTKSNPTVGL